jgi:hypothetical protein
MTYNIVLMTSEGIKVLETKESYSECDHLIDGWYDVYPNGWIEIISEQELTFSPQYND